VVRGETLPPPQSLHWLRLLEQTIGQNTQCEMRPYFAGGGALRPAREHTATRYPGALGHYDTLAAKIMPGLMVRPQKHPITSIFPGGHGPSGIISGWTFLCLNWAV